MPSRESIVTAMQIAAVIVILYFVFGGYMTPKIDKSQARTQISEMSGIPARDIEVHGLEYKDGGWTEVRASVTYEVYGDHQKTFLCNQTKCKLP